MKTSIHGAVLTLLLAFSAPVSLTEMLTGQEQESVFDLSRPGRSVARHASAPKPPDARRADLEPLPPARRPRQSARPTGFLEEWIRPIFSRPPPL